MRKTKIICTLGPASDTEEMIKRLVLGGMACARFNFSHGNHASHQELLNKLRKVGRELDAPVAAMLDTRGPEIRIKSLKSPVTLEAGGEFTLTTRDVQGDSAIVSVTYPNLHEELSVDCRVLIDDGLIELRVLRIDGADIVCRVENGGELSSNKSINIPDAHISLPTLTEQDKADILFAAENEFDFIAASFIRRASDIGEIRAFLRECGGENVQVIAKIENGEGVRNMDGIISAADGVMVARGDLGVEIAAFDVPVAQKRIVSKCVRHGKPVIIATQMLDSMIRNPRPTRAEVSDVANAVFEYASCVMLSGETASGKYPEESLKVMADTLRAAENEMRYWQRFSNAAARPDGTVSGAISHSCCLTAMDLHARAILASTTSGHTAKVISRYMPGCDVIALTPSERVRRQLALYWGVASYLIKPADSTDAMIERCIRRAAEAGAVEKGDTVIITAGVPVGISGTTNLIKAQIVE